VQTGSTIVTVLSLASVLAANAQAQPAEAPSPVPKISGFIDTTFNYNANRPKSGKNTFFSYSAQHNNFSVNTADVSLSGTIEGLSYYVQVDAGSDAVVNSFAYSTGTIFDLQEAYAQYTSPNQWGVKVGKFVTYHGIELIESGSDPTISRGFLFGLAEPATHVGGVATYQATPEVDIAIGLINGWDLFADNNKFKMAVAKVGINLGDPLGLTLSSYVGPDQANNTDHYRATFDVTGVSKQGLTTINFQGNFGFEQQVTMMGEDDFWYGFGIQPVFKLADQVSLGLRGEMFYDDKGSRGGVPAGASLFDLTITPGYLVTPAFLIRGEARLDVSNKDAFEAHDGTAASSQLIGMVEALASF